MKYPEDYINKIICGDCLEVMKGIPDKSIDVIMTDIPYGEVNREDNGLRNLDKQDADVMTIDLNKLILELHRVCRGSHYIFCGTEQVSHIHKCFVNLELSTRLCIWEKTNPSPMNGEYIWLSGIECCVYAKNKGAQFKEFCKNTVFRYPTENDGRKIKHPTEKPLDLIKYLISVSAIYAGNVILDPFMGSGTSIVASKQLGLDYIGIEINPKYCEIAQRRLAQEYLFT